MARNYRTLQEIMALPPQQRFSQFQEVGIDCVKIDGNEIRDYKAYRFIWEKTYVQSPERSTGGSLGALNSSATYLVGHLYLDFSLMSIEEYRLIMDLHYSKNEFIVECRDIINKKPIKIKMYFATEEVAKLFTLANTLFGGDENNVMLLGVQDYTVELIGTNNDLDLISVMYYPNYESIETNQTPYPTFEAEDDVYMGEEIMVGSNSTYPDNPPNGYKFKHWIDDNGIVYSNGSYITVNSPLNLYAVWEISNTATLTFDYGLSSIYIENGTEKTNKEVQYNQAIGELPLLENSPAVTFDDTTNFPYHSPTWRKSPSDKSEQVTSSTPYWSTRNSTIYAVYSTYKYSISFVTNIPEITLPTIFANYNTNIALPNLIRTGYTFDGWYRNSNFTGNKIVWTTMPPFSVTLYAKWTENK